MEKYVFTGFSAEHWNRCGASWIASLIELAKFDGKVIIFAHDALPSHVLEKLDSNGVTVIEGHPSPPVNGRDLTFLMAEPWIAKDPGIYIYWDGDVYFQNSVDLLFGEVKKSLITAGTMIGGTSDVWAVFFDFYQFAKMVRPVSFADALFEFAKFVPNMVTAQENVWNFSDLSLLRWDDGFKYQDKLVPVVNPAKFNSDEYSFQGRYQTVYRQWKNNYSTKSLLYNYKKNISTCDIAENEPSV